MDQRGNVCGSNSDSDVDVSVVYQSETGDHGDSEMRWKAGQALSRVSVQTKPCYKYYSVITEIKAAA